MFGKKNEIGVTKPLSEEEIQKKLYGKYKPGTLGKVIKVNEDEKDSADVTEDSEVKSVEPDLFSDISSLEIVPPSDPVEDNVMSAHAGMVDESTHVGIKAEEVMQDESDEELFQLDLNKEDPQTFSIQEDKYVSFKLGFHELLDGVRSFGLKYLFVGSAVLVAIILVFNVISSYIGGSEYSDSIEYEMVDKEAITENADTAELVVAETMERRNVVAVPVVRVEEVPSTVSAEVAVEKYTVQICVSNNQEATDALIGDLQDKDFSAFYRKSQTRSGKELFFVYVGKFSTREDANAAMKSYRKNSVLKKYDDSFVTNIKKD